MKILLINALLKELENSAFPSKLFPNIFTIPSLSLPCIASATSDRHSVMLLDEAFDKVDYNKDYDLIGISCVHTASAPRAYQLADEFRKRGKTVILGGCHPSALPDEAKQHADSVIIGEAEQTWPQLLREFEHGKLKSFYYPTKPVDPKDIPSTRHRLMNKNPYVAGIYASRGCAYDCEFCSIRYKNYGCIFRTRPIKHVIEEIKAIPQRFLIFYDSTFTINIEYTKSLFREMKCLNKKFRCWMNADIPLHDEEFLKLAKEAGCIAIWIGFESLSQKTIDVMGKKTNTVRLYKEIIRKIHDHGISVSGIFVFGFDTDTKDVFDETLQHLSSLDIDFPRFAILTPYPGTPLYEELEKEQRILTRDWSKYDTNHVVFQPKQMSPDDLESEYLRLYGEVYAPSNVVKRIIRIPNQTFSSWILNAISNIQSWRYFTTC